MKLREVSLVRIALTPFSVNYNTKVGGKGYKVTVKDPNFNAIEDRMLCRLHRLTKIRFEDIAKSQQKVMLGSINPEKSDQIRDHLTLVHAISVSHELIKDKFPKRPVLLPDEIFSEIGRARECILRRIHSKNLAFSPRLETRTIQLACTMSLIGYFKSVGEHIEIDKNAINLAIQFYIEEAAIRSQEDFDSNEILKELYII